MSHPFWETVLDVALKLATLMFKTLHSQELQYLSNECQLVPGADRSLWWCCGPKFSWLQFVWCGQSARLEHIASSNTFGALSACSKHITIILVEENGYDMINATKCKDDSNVKWHCLLSVSWHGHISYFKSLSQNWADGWQTIPIS